MQPADKLTLYEQLEALSSGIRAQQATRCSTRSLRNITHWLRLRAPPTRAEQHEKDRITELVMGIVPARATC